MCDWMRLDLEPEQESLCCRLGCDPSFTLTTRRVARNTSIVSQRSICLRNAPPGWVFPLYFIFSKANFSEHPPPAALARHINRR
jgi:hypothetical protein